MNGFVDDSERALARLRIKHPTDPKVVEIEAWIDTGFTGELVAPKDLLDSLGLPLGPTVKARLADGSEIQLDTYTCLLEWFKEWRRIEVVANEGHYPLLGIGLLLNHDLHIGFPSRSVNIE